MVKELKLLSLSLKQLSERIKSGEISPVDLIEICLGRIEKLNPTLNAFITVIEKEHLYKQAQIAEKEIKQGNHLSPLHGIPFSIKDIFYAKGIRCTAGSKILTSYIPHADATVVKRMKKAGAILIGTNNLNEFASGITGINPFYGSSKNPWNISKISGGSSGGSAVAVATGMVPISLGTDTGGSIRVPSSLCGVTGLKPTYGRVSKHGIMSLAPSLDHIGCITRSAWDAGAILQAIAGQDAFDPSPENEQVPDYVKTIDERKITTCKNLSVGVPKEYFFDYLEPQVKRVFHDFIDTIKSMDIILTEINLNKTDKIYDSWAPIRLAEAAEIHLEWLETRAKDYGEDVRRMLIEGTKISAVKYIRAQRFRNEIRNEFMRIFKNVDVLVMPTTPLTAPTFDERIISIDGKVHEIRQVLLRNNIAFNSTGLPAVSIPVGLANHNMPVGVQIVGRPFEEDKILSIAYTYESVNDSLLKFIPALAAT